jgi:DDE superfamily endonuclease
MSSWKIPSVLSTWITRLENMIDRRLRDVFPLVFCGLLMTQERRRTCTSWFRAAGITSEFRRGYRVICLTGREAESMGMSILYTIANSPAAAKQERIKLTLDDTPSQRYGPKVEGAGLHHNPTPGPANQPFLYGHVFVTLAWAVDHPDWGTTSLPVRSELYVRQKDVPKIPPERGGWEFRTKIEQAVELIEWAGKLLSHKAQPIWMGVDGGYANRKVIDAAKGGSITLVGRLRKDAGLRSVPGPQPAGKRGRKPKYGKKVISLAKRAGHRQGWVEEEMTLYGEKVLKTYKTFLATWQPAGGAIRVVVVKEEEGWFAFFCIDPNATPAEILGMVGDRNSIEQTFKDVKETWGAGQQQVRNIDASIGAWHMNLWAYTMTELWAWEKRKEELVDRSRSPWDDKPRRPSHADRRKALLYHSLQEEFQAAQTGADHHEKLLAFAERLMLLAA